MKQILAIFICLSLNNTMLHAAATSSSQDSQPKQNPASLIEQCIHTIVKNPERSYYNPKYLPSELNDQIKHYAQKAIYQKGALDCDQTWFSEEYGFDHCVLTRDKRLITLMALPMAGNDDSINIWNPITGEQLGELKTDPTKAFLYSFFLSHDQKKLFVEEDDRWPHRMCVFDLDNYVFNRYLGETLPANDRHSYSLTHDDKQLYEVSPNGISIIDVATGNYIQKNKESDGIDKTPSITLNDTDTLLFLALQNNIIIYDAHSLKLLKSIPLPSNDSWDDFLRTHIIFNNKMLFVSKNFTQLKPNKDGCYYKRTTLSIHPDTHETKIVLSGPGYHTQPLIKNNGMRNWGLSYFKEDKEILDIFGPDNALKHRFEDTPLPFCISDEYIVSKSKDNKFVLRNIPLTAPALRVLDILKKFEKKRKKDAEAKDHSNKKLCLT